MVITSHEANQSFNAIVHTHKRTRLLALIPDLNLIWIAGKRDLSADRRRRLFFATIIGAKRAVDVVETR
jgi:hypothetical protein